jgi:hypothetical protein
MFHGGAKQRNVTLALALKPDVLALASHILLMLMIKLFCDVDAESC